MCLINCDRIAIILWWIAMGRLKSSRESKFNGRKNFKSRLRQPFICSLRNFKARNNLCSVINSSFVNLSYCYLSRIVFKFIYYITGNTLSIKLQSNQVNYMQKLRSEYSGRQQQEISEEKKSKKAIKSCGCEGKPINMMGSRGVNIVRVVHVSYRISQ